MSKLPELEFLSWEALHGMADDLAQELKVLRPDLDTMVSVARGGHVLARILSDFMDLPIYSVSIQSYAALQRHEIQITQELDADLIGKHVLLVDEIVDSGQTLKRALEYLADLGAETVTSAALHVKPSAIMQSDVYSDVTEKWVVYPYEVRETVEALLPIWLQEGLTAADLEARLVRGGMSQRLVRRFVAAATAP